MITIKLSADNLRLLRGAKSEPELRGVVDMVLGRVEQAEALKVFGKRVQPARSERVNKYDWKKAKDVMAGVLGDSLRAPPFPDYTWYQRVHRALKQYDLGEEKLIEIAEYARDHLKPPYSFEFLVCQHERILAGNFDSVGAKRGASASGPTGVIPNWRKNVLPED